MLKEKQMTSQETIKNIILGHLGPTWKALHNCTESQMKNDILSNSKAFYILKQGSI